MKNSECFATVDGGPGFGRPALVLGLLALGLATAPVHAQVITADCPTGFGPVIVPFIPLSSLKTVPNPVLPKVSPSGPPGLRADLVPYIADLPAAIRLGKALFWEMQAGSDNRTACATCHFHAGADHRDRNQLHPGPNGRMDGGSVNASLGATNFPFTSATADRDDIAGSQGVRKSVFVRNRYSKPEVTRPVADTVFKAAGVNVRQVTGKNTPSTINAVFNHRNFHDGRAQPEFNGVNPFGVRDSSARVWRAGADGGIEEVGISIQNAGLASQAVAPAVSSTEMSAAGRTFQTLGARLLRARPLAFQKVSPSDSVLGAVASPVTGLSASYGSMIEQAFQPAWWRSGRKVSISGNSHTLKEANFSLYWGLAIMLYEATLVADNSPVDQYLDTGRTSLAALNTAAARISLLKPGTTAANITNGLALFEQPLAPVGAGVGCIGCHVGAETTSATVQNLTGHGFEPGDAALRNKGFDLRLERMFGAFPPVPAGTDQVVFDPATYSVTVTRSNGVMVPQPFQVRVGVYDTGWYNIGVRPTAEDQGLGGLDPFGQPLSWTRSLQSSTNPGAIRVPGGGLACAGVGNATFPNETLNPATELPLLAGPLTSGEESDVAGSFKVPGLRNVEFTGPYFHNGGKATLRQVIGFYKKGGDFANPTLAPLMMPLNLSAADMNDLVAFLLALTDERVRWQQAPFDHPQLFVPNGDADAASGTDNLVEIPAVGASGAEAPLGSFLNLDPFQP